MNLNCFSPPKSALENFEFRDLISGKSELEYRKAVFRRFITGSKIKERCTEIVVYKPAKLSDLEIKQSKNEKKRNVCDNKVIHEFDAKCKDKVFMDCKTNDNTIFLVKACSKEI
ncbi:hypothetical protein COBT_003944, partial [Conglomerata obtusa]